MRLRLSKVTSPGNAAGSALGIPVGLFCRSGVTHRDGIFEIASGNVGKGLPTYKAGIAAKVAAPTETAAAGSEHAAVGLDAVPAVARTHCQQ